MNKSTDQPLVDIVMPAYNAGACIEQSIKSVLQQNYDNWRLWICNDASTDHTINIAKKYSHTFDKITILIHNANQGPAAARNTCLQRCDGDYIAFLDSDDTWHPDKLLCQVQAMRTFGLLISYTEYWATSKNKHKKIITLPTSINLGSLLKKNSILLSSAMIRRDNSHVYTMPNVPHEDYVFWCRLFKDSKITAHLVRHHEPLCTYRLAPNSLSHNKLRAAYWHWINLRRDLNLPLPVVIFNFTAYILSSINKYKENFCLSMIKPIRTKL